MKQVLRFILLFVSTTSSYAATLVDATSDKVVIQKWALYDSDAEVQYKADKACKIYGKKAKKIGNACPPQELYVNPHVIFACVEKSGYYDNL